MSFLALVGQLFWFFTPTAFANMAPVLFRNRFEFLNKRVDGGRTFRGQPLFGAHKTWRGIVVATLVGGLTYSLQYWLGWQYPAMAQWFPFDVYKIPWWIGFGFGATAIFGDLIKSFFKRRFAKKSGQTWFPFDQLDSVIASAVLATILFDFTWVMWVLSLTVWAGLHVIANHVAFWLGMKETKW